MIRLRMLMMLTLFAAAAAADAQNLLRNPGFATGTSHWQVSSAAADLTWSSIDASGNAGSGSARLQNNHPNIANGVSMHQCVPLQAGKPYRFGGRVMLPSGAGQTLKNHVVVDAFFASNAQCTTFIGGPVALNGLAPTAFDAWVSGQEILTVPSGAVAVMLRGTVARMVAGSTAIVHFDDLLIEPTQADVAIDSISVAPSEPVPIGAPYEYVVSVVNAGPAHAVGTVVGLEWAAVPQVLEFMHVEAPPGWTCQTPAQYADQGVLECTTPTLAAGAAADLRFGFRSKPGGMVFKDVTFAVAADNEDPEPANNTLDYGTLFTPAWTELGIGIAPVPPGRRGEIRTVSATIVNAGPHPGPALVELTVPPGLGFAAMAAGAFPPGWTCTLPAAGSAGVAHCAHPALAVGEHALTFALTIGMVAGGTELVVEAAVSGPNLDDQAGDDSASVAIAVLHEVELAIVPAQTSVTLTEPMAAIELVAFNLGPDVAPQAKVDVAIPPAWDLLEALPVSEGWTCTLPLWPLASDLRCTHAHFAPNADAPDAGRIHLLVAPVDPAAQAGTTARIDVLISAEAFVLGGLLHDGVDLHVPLRPPAVFRHGFEAP